MTDKDKEVVRDILVAMISDGLLNESADVRTAKIEAACAAYKAIADKIALQEYDSQPIVIIDNMGKD